METLLTVAFPGGALGLFFKIAIACVIAWVVWEIIKWWLAKTGTSIPRPVVVIFWGIVAIIIIYWLFELIMLIL